VELGAPAHAGNLGSRSPRVTPTCRPTVTRFRLRFVVRRACWRRGQHARSRRPKHSAWASISPIAAVHRGTVSLGRGVRGGASGIGTSRVPSSPGALPLPSYGGGSTAPPKLDVVRGAGQCAWLRDFRGRVDNPARSSIRGGQETSRRDGGAVFVGWESFASAADEARRTHRLAASQRDRDRVRAGPRGSARRCSRIPAIIPHRFRGKPRPHPAAPSRSTGFSSGEIDAAVRQALRGVRQRVRGRYRAAGCSRARSPALPREFCEVCGRGRRATRRPPPPASHPARRSWHSMPTTFAGVLDTIRLVGRAGGVPGARRAVRGATSSGASPLSKRGSPADRRLAVPGARVARSAVRPGAIGCRRWSRLGGRGACLRGGRAPAFVRRAVGRKTGRSGSRRAAGDSRAGSDLVAAWRRRGSLPRVALRRGAAGDPLPRAPTAVDATRALSRPSRGHASRTGWSCSLRLLHPDIFPRAHRSKAERLCGA